MNVLFFTTVGKGKGKVRRGGVQKKDKQRKRCGSFPVSVPVKGGHSVFKVSVPLSSLPSNILPAHHQHASITSPPFIHSASVSTQPSHSQPHSKGKLISDVLCPPTCLCVAFYMKKRCVQSKPSKRCTAGSGWLALISTVDAWLLCYSLDLQTLGRPA